MAGSTLAALTISKSHCSGGGGESEGEDENKGVGGVVAITKHLCGGATDASLVALCAPPLDVFIAACCFAPCCHQKTKRTQYCNLSFLEARGFCHTHVGVRGQVQDVDWKNFRMLISMSKGGLNAGVTEGGEYKNSQLLQVLGRDRACALGRKARRLLEEGRMQYLQQHGFSTTLVRYCDESVTGDNWAIIARKEAVLACSC
jgi:tRNA:m4X modification enzyme